MVLESLLGARLAEKRGFTLLVLSVLITSAGLWFTYYLFPQSASVLSLAFTTIAFMPMLQAAFRLEEEEESLHSGASIGFLLRHGKIIKVYGMIFLGIMVAYAFWFIVLPATTPANCPASGRLECLLPTQEQLFLEQNKSIEAISGSSPIARVSGVGAGECKNPATASFWKCTEFIYVNNSLVLGLAILFSFIWGAGAIFLLGWNASIIGIFLGKEATMGFGGAVARFLSYIPHGSFEVMGYFAGAIAGGIISVTITKGSYRKKELTTIAKDAFASMVLAYWLLLIAAMIESYLIISALGI
ncbi:MAG: stage II sporulation protein M [Candidatus Diapherotrites archaeon]|nr:stage II sporulation protein M [Candidatus Diapherotrites archaeon]